MLPPRLALGRGPQNSFATACRQGWQYVTGTVRKYSTVRIYFGQKVRYASTVRNIRSSTGTIRNVRWYAVEMSVPNVPYQNGYF